MSAAHKNECPVAAGQVVNQSTENNPHFTQVHRAWLAIISVANSLAPDALVFGMGMLYGLALATVVVVAA